MFIFGFSVPSWLYSMESPYSGKNWGPPLSTNPQNITKIINLNKKTVKGGILVALGAASYGMLTTFVKMAYEEGYTIWEVTFSQIFLGCIGLWMLGLFLKKKEKNKFSKKPTRRTLIKLILAGTTFGLTSIFYYLAVRTIPISIGIVLLMQSVWMGVALEAIINKTRPSGLKILAVVLILIGTLLATNVLLKGIEVDFLGFAFGVLAAMSYTVMLYCSNTMATSLPSLTRSKWMMLGGLILVSIITVPTFITGFNFGIFYKWAPILALFGTVLPPLFLTSGMPKLNVGLGVIISSFELPVAVLMGYFLLNENVNTYQWTGIFIILFAIVVINLKKLKKSKLSNNKLDRSR